MATQPTQDSVPSESPRDLKFNAGKIDEFVTSLVNTYVDRFGNAHYTIEGLRWLAQQAIAQYGWILIDSFQDGADIALPNQALRDEDTGEYYRWDGALPKHVDAGSTPASSGGVGIGAWVGIGDASLRAMLASSEDGEGDSLIAVKSPLAGAVARTQHDKNAETVSVTDFMDLTSRVAGVTDDGPAFNAALSASGYVDIPAGNYLIATPVAVSGKAVRLRGKGVGVTNIKCSLTSGAMITILPTAGSHFVDIGDFSCSCSALPSSNVSAIIIDGSAQLTSDTYKGMYLVGERERRRALITNIDYNCVDSTHGFNYGLRFKCLLNFSFSDMTFYGPADNYSAEAYSIEGQGVPVDIRANNLYAYNCKIGLNMPDYVEALYLKEFEFVNVKQGISNVYNSSRSVVPSSVTERSNSLKIGPGHINCNGPTAANFTGAAYLNMKEMLVVVGPQSETQKIGINLTGSNYPKIENMQFVSTLGTTTNPRAMFCVAGAGVTNGQLNSNSANGFNEVIHLSGSSSDNVINDNINRSGGVGVAVVLADSTCVSNTLRNNDSDGSTIVNVASDQNDIGTTDYISYTTITLSAIAAGGSQNVSIPIPPTIYKAAPDIGILNSANGANNLIGEYYPTSSSATSAVFRVHSAAGAAVSAGTYNVCVMVSKKTG